MALHSRFHFLASTLAVVAFLCSCSATQKRRPHQTRPVLNTAHVSKIAPLIDPARLSTLKGKRAANPRLKKACYWLETARREGADLKATITEAHQLTGHDHPAREAEQSTALIRNLTILDRLQCLDQSGMEKLRKGYSPIVQRGPYSGEKAAVDHIIPRSICPELDNSIFNLEFLPETLNRRKSNRVTQRQVTLAERWYQQGILSRTGLEQVQSAHQ